MEQTPQNLPGNLDNFDVQKLLVGLLQNWYWIVICAVIGFALATIQLRYMNDVFTSKAHIKVLSNRETAEINIDLTRLTTKSSINLENEMAALKSFRLHREVVERLKINIRYFRLGRIQTLQLYSPPFVVEHRDDLDPGLRYNSFDVVITPTGYTITNADETAIMVEGYDFNDATPQFPITITAQDDAAEMARQTGNYLVTIASIEATAKRLSQNLTVELYGEFSDILTLSLNGYSTQFTESVINTLIEVYTEDGVKDRQEVSKRTIEFIDERFVYLATELDSIERNKKNYKQSNNLSIFTADAGATLRSQEVKDERRFEAETQLLLADILEKSLTTGSTFDLLPANIGLSSSAVNGLVDKYNTSVLEYNKLKSSAGGNNPTLQVLMATIQDLNTNIANSLTAYKAQLNEQLQQNLRAQQLVNSSFRALPNQEMVLRSIERQQNLKETLYILLLQKREEASIQMAIMTPNVKVVDYATSNSTPISPNRQRIKLIGLMLGMVIPIGIIALKEMLNNKVYQISDIAVYHPDATVVGEVPYLRKGEAKEGRDTHPVTESFRTMAHNLQFLWPDKTQTGKTVCVTSNIKGEGKTFVAYHLAMACAAMKKRVLLVGADLRNPQLHTLFGVDKNRSGLSNYLSDDSINWQDLLYKTDRAASLDVLFSGDIPPMPSVLLASDRFEQLINQLKQQYDLVIIDTAPVIPVADTLTFAAKADATISVARYAFTPKHLIEHAAKLEADKKLHNLVYVLNAIDFKRIFGYLYGYGYGYSYNYGYGYGYKAGEAKKPWYRFWG
jgi:capsular exopolysaccharide synthesis family protein